MRLIIVILFEFCFLFQVMAQPQPTEELPISPETETDESKSLPRVKEQINSEKKTEVESSQKQHLDKTSAGESISIEDSLILRDPFRKPAKFAAPGADDSIPELERYGLEQLKIVGIITGPKRPKALVATPNNKMFIVQENDKMGLHKGILRKIKDKSIIVRETLVNLVGQEESTDNEMYLAEGDQSKKQ